MLRFLSRILMIVVGSVLLVLLTVLQILSVVLRLVFFFFEFLFGWLLSPFARWRYRIPKQSSSESKYQDEIETLYDIVQDKAFEQAEEEARLFLAEEVVFQVTLTVPEQTEEPLLLAELGPTLRRFFAEFEEIRKGDCLLVSKHSLRRADWTPPSVVFIELNNNEDTHLVAHPGEDTVWEVEDDLPLEHQGLERFKFHTIFHWLLFMAYSEGVSPDS